MSVTYDTFGGKNMIDTIRIESPYIDDIIANKIENSSIIRTGIDMNTGELIYKFTSNQLKGTYDSSIMIKIENEKFISDYDCKGNKIVRKINTEPYLLVECSLNKFFLGHNCYGGSDDIEKQIRKLIQYIENVFCIQLPEVAEWIVKRIDYAKVYFLGDSIYEFFEGFNNVYYPRRKIVKYNNTGIYAPGAYTSLKLYHKGEEFRKHDKKRLMSFVDKEYVQAIEQLAMGILRIELEVKSKKLKHIYNGNLPKVSEIKVEDLINQYNVELKRIFKIGEDNMKVYTNCKEVEKVLFKNYKSQGSIYYGTWFRLAINGYDKVKNEMPKKTFYRHINKLKDVGVMWNNTDVLLKENKIANFVFNPFQCDKELNADLVKFKIV